MMEGGWSPLDGAREVAIGGCFALIITYHGAYCIRRIDLHHRSMGVAREATWASYLACPYASYGPRSHIMIPGLDSSKVF